ncbi:radical SAM/SPASM domain-containing protein [Nonomuraea angiospora]|uniref:radical SAM/SPASM domain-containing protein n=1 Tax=Nonomuraea angiospora TaxID=46172 RepID=UPI0029B13814|nr:radical SAM/SPASM domain-containing protein [Nonomuraea angiospora]MDX3101770.1 radical SAM/SPASM domain-containing protein [Nonomuraea angiospora]
MTLTPLAPPEPELGFLWLEVTGRCQLECVHCYADSGPTGTHGTMTYVDWLGVVDQAADLGVRMVQMIGGEPTLWPGLPGLVTAALSRGLEVEVYTNLVHITPAMWDLFAMGGVRLATSYYSDDPAQHRQITGRSTLPRTRANIAKAVEADIPLRVGIIDLGEGQRVDQAQAELAQLGVKKMSVDRMRLLGRPARRACDASELCGSCGNGIAAILPDGSVTPCPLARWLTAGNLAEAPLAELAGGVRELAARQIRPALPHACTPPCEPQCTPGCNPSVNKPGGGDGCNPKKNCVPEDPCKPRTACQPDVTPTKK